jgi:SAM-dependent methyltransferase
MNPTQVAVGLEALAKQYGNTCLDLAASKDTTGEALREADDALWCLTRELCRGIENASEGSAAAFRAGVFRDEVLKWFVQHPHTARLWAKPAGYSGDYATIEWLCANKQAWTCLADIFSNHVLRCTMAEQHREKVRAQQAFFMPFLEREVSAVHIADFGCGPSLALKMALKACVVTSAQILLVDLDPNALDSSRKHLSPFSSRVDCEYRQGDVVQMLRQLTRSNLKFDAITFGGLFDYLPDKAAVFVLRNSVRLPRQGGALFFTQVSPSNPDGVFMDWWGDWRLIQRDEDELIHLCLQAGIALESMVLCRESTNCAILATVTSPE